VNGTHHLLVYIDDIKSVGGNINTISKTQKKKLYVLVLTS